MLAVGHAPAPVVDAIAAQAQKFVHVCALVATYEPYVRLAELLNEITPGDVREEDDPRQQRRRGVENAVKLARKFTGRPAVICFEGGYHGRTLLTLSLTSKYGLFKSGFGPFAPEIVRLPIPQSIARPPGMTEEQYVDFGIRQLEHALVAQVDPSAVAAMIIEPVQGEAGFIPVPPRFLQRIRELCDAARHRDDRRRGAVRLRAAPAACSPSSTTAWCPTSSSPRSRSAAGMPIGAVTGRAEIMDAPHLGGVGGTYGGSPVACAAAIEAVEHHPPAGVPRPCPPPRRRDARGDARLAGAVADRRRRPRARPDDAGRVRAAIGPPRTPAAPEDTLADRPARGRQRRRRDARRSLQQLRAAAAAADDARGHAARGAGRARPRDRRRVGTRGRDGAA